MSERCAQTNERPSKWPITLRVDSTVIRHNVCPFFASLADLLIFCSLGFYVSTTPHFLPCFSSCFSSTILVMILGCFSSFPPKLSFLSFTPCHCLRPIISFMQRYFFFLTRLPSYLPSSSLFSSTLTRLPLSLNPFSTFSSASVPNFLLPLHLPLHPFLFTLCS